MLLMGWFLGLQVQWAVAVAASSIRVVETTSRSVEVEIRYERPYLRKEFGHWKFIDSEWPLRGDLGGPLLPRKDFFLSVPDGRDVTISTVSIARSARIPLDAPLLYRAFKLTHAPVNQEVPIDPRLYKRTYGTQVSTVEELSYAGRDRLARIRLEPARYDGHGIDFLERARIRFDFVPTQHWEAAPVNGSEGEIASILAINAKKRAPTEVHKCDLVIAHQGYQNNQELQRLLTFKKMMGREVREYYVPKQTTSQITTIIKKEYQSASPPTHTLLVGSIDQIPSFPDDEANWSDFHYSTLDSGDIPDISVGRIPAQNATELENFVNKAITRQLESTNVTEVLLTAGGDTSLGCPQNVSVVGEKIKPAGNDIHLIKKYKTEVSTKDVIDAYNANPNLIIYDGHGDEDGMQEIPLTISTLNQLRNTSFPIILDIACLNANWNSSGAARRNFAESILFLKGAGAVGILASGGSGYGHDFFQYLGEYMATGRKNLAIDSTQSEIGRVVLLGKIRGDSEDRTFWNYYGDPATSVWEPTIH